MRAALGAEGGARGAREGAPPPKGACGPTHPKARPRPGCCARGETTGVRKQVIVHTESLRMPHTEGASIRMVQMRGMPIQMVRRCMKGARHRWCADGMGWDGMARRWVKEGLPA